MKRTPPRRAAVLLLALTFTSCSLIEHRPPEAPPAPAPLPPAPEPLPVKKVQEEIIVAAWAEPAQLARGGGQAQILVRVQKRGGTRFPGVEVRLASSTGTLYSGGKILITDAQGVTRDRLTTRKTASITLNAGGTRYTFHVNVSEGDSQ